MLPGYIIETVLALCIAAVVYHHIGYPILLRGLARTVTQRNSAPIVDAGGEVSSEARGSPLPSIVIVVPAHNEQDVIAAKIENIDRLDYPADRLSVLIALDGCTDATKATAEAAIARAKRGHLIRLVDYTVNRGKIAVLNEQIAAASADIVALNDASGLIDTAALMRAAHHFRNERIGVVCATYVHPAAGSEGEAAYWRLQTKIKEDEAAVAAPMGAHGALYFFRRSLWKPLPPDTINDDFVLPMQIVTAGYRAVYDRSIVATELEPTVTTAEFRRRVRIGAGNMQQAVRLKGLANPKVPGVAFVFLSGKGMRPFVPFMILLAVLATLALAVAGEEVFQLLLVAELSIFALAAAATQVPSERLPRPVAWLSYLLLGHTASALGALVFLTGHWNGPWRPSSGSVSVLPERETVDAIPRSVIVAKRGVDIFAGLAGVMLLALLWLPVALAIRIESRGPIVYSQRRVGRSTREATHLFNLFKFRSMYADAEKLTGPVFAGENDPRITRVGSFLRKTRIDELPQFVNVLKGEMSFIGPRPERPYFVRKLNEDLPFYPERTTGLRPGMTGLAQVNQTYEESVKDVGKKVAYDHAYALRLSRGFRAWIETDLEVVLKTLKVVCERTG